MSTTAEKAVHTPGPWIVGRYRNPNSGEVSLSVWRSDVQIGEIGNPVCLVTPEEKADERDEANASLIAAAPEMLKALEAVRLELHEANLAIRNRNFMRNPELTIEAERLADAAIRKAQGEQ